MVKIKNTALLTKISKLKICGTRFIRRLVITLHVVTLKNNVKTKGVYHGLLHNLIYVFLKLTLLPIVWLLVLHIGYTTVISLNILYTDLPKLTWSHLQLFMEHITPWFHKEGQTFYRL